MEDMNTTEYLSKIKRAVYENLRDIDAAPSVQMQSESLGARGTAEAHLSASSDVPKMPHDDEDDKENEDMEDPDTRLHSEHSPKRS